MELHHWIQRKPFPSPQTFDQTSDPNLALQTSLYMYIPHCGHRLLCSNARTAFLNSTALENIPRACLNCLNFDLEQPCPSQRGRAGQGCSCRHLPALGALSWTIWMCPNLCPQSSARPQQLQWNTLETVTVLELWPVRSCRMFWVEGFIPKCVTVGFLLA